MWPNPAWHRATPTSGPGWDRPRLRRAPIHAYARVRLAPTPACGRSPRVAGPRVWPNLPYGRHSSTADAGRAVYAADRVRVVCVSCDGRGQLGIASHPCRLEVSRACPDPPFLAPNVPPGPPGAPPAPWRAPRRP
ncbi:hypothetical protein Shyhy02_66080 [Streptomyces hygroscopicus subsp. hygroscopicus]|nr:hypothetical protein Shyhy02_66080 [Streptomyces hygroscopicus subsp. hygroscopicus]